MGTDAVRIVCPQCRVETDKPTGHLNRSRSIGAPVYCGRRCAGLARRTHKTKAQKVEEKCLYDANYRKKNRKRLKAKKAAYHKRTYDPVKAAVERKRKMPWHIAYCRRPEYKRWKSKYDRRHRAKKNYGPFAEVAMLTVDLNREIKWRASIHDIKWQNKTANKAQFRKKEEGQTEKRRRPRYRDRRDPHSAVVG